MAGIPGTSGLPHKCLPVGDTVKADICDDHLVGQLFIEEYIARGQVLVDNVSCVQVSHPLGGKERSKRSWNKYFESKKSLWGVWVPPNMKHSRQPSGHPSNTIILCL